MYNVRILMSGNCGEVIKSYSSYSEALSSFLFCLDATIDLSLSVRSINLFKGKKSINCYKIIKLWKKKN